MSRLIEIKTGPFNEVLDSDSWIYVLVGENTYVKKRAGDLLVGDRAFVEKETSTLSLREIEPFMEMFSDYVLARDTVSVETRSGELTPLFRLELIRGLASKVGIVGGNLDDRLMLNQDSLDGGEVRSIVDYLSGKGVDRSTATNWVSGKVVVPLRRNLEIVSGEDSRIRRFYDELTSRDGNFYHSYNYWRVARQQIMRALAEISDDERQHEANGNLNEAPPSTHIDQMPVVDGVIKILAERGRLERSIAFSKVRGRKRIRDETTLQSAPERSPYKGFTRTSPDDFGFREIPMSNLFEDQKVLVEALTELLNNEVKRVLNFPQYLGTHVLMLLIGNHIAYRDPNVDDSLRFMSQFVGGDPQLYGKLSSLAADIYRGMHNGVLDQQYDLTAGTSKKLFETCLTLRRALPVLYYRQVVALNGKIRAESEGPLKPKHRKRVSREINELETALKTVYGIDFYRKILPTAEFKNAMFIPDYESSLTGFGERSAQIREGWLRQDYGFYTPAEINGVFARYDLRAARKFIRPVNFMIIGDS